MSQAARDIPIPLKLSGLDEPEWTLTKKNSAGAVVAATGETVTVFYSLTRPFTTAAAIHADLSATASERAGKPGTYSCTMTEAAKTSHLSTLVGRVIYEIMSVDDVAQEYQARLVVDE